MGLIGMVVGAVVVIATGQKVMKNVRKLSILSISINYNIIYQTARFIIGYEDPDTQQFTDKKMNEWIQSHEGKKVIELPPGENYF